jgi:hypothetical protein
VEDQHLKSFDLVVRTALALTPPLSVSCGSMRSLLTAEPRPARSKPIATTSPRPYFG